jgi:hypothetical protein
MLNFTADIPLLWEELGLPSLALRITHQNRGPSPTNYRMYYPDSLRKEVARFYEREVDLGEYTFEGQYKKVKR